MRKLMKKKQDKIQEEIIDNTEEISIVDDENLDDTPLSTADDMEQVAQTINEIKQQNAIQAMFSGSKNERALAENDARISNVIKSILNWLAIITSAENIRREEYDELTNRMIKFDEDVNDQLQMQVKFKKAYEIMQARQEEQKKLECQVKTLKCMCIGSIILGILGIVLAISL